MCNFFLCFLCICDSSVATQFTADNNKMQQDGSYERRDSIASTFTTSSLQSKRTSMSNIANKVNNDVSLFTESINVIVRCRGRGFRDNELNSPNAVFISDSKPNEVKLTFPDQSLSIKDSNSNNSDELDETSRIYKLDKVYGPTTDQMTFFQNAAENICNDFLKGFNCTIFAYGQTGAGKTYTMCGKVRDNSLTPESGIIPRCLKKLFEDNENNNNNDLIFRCSFVEIYNEILKDLLSDGKNDKHLKIYEHNKIIKIKALEEFYIKDFNEAMQIFKMGLDKRKTAATKMNDISSRSHTIFTIHLLKKRSNGSEYQFSKLNLVDLAGSENIGKSGSINQRAREAGSINQSLLTLGRVINSLVDGSNFIPYRESKLTRLLQDSLGGKTKTILVANVAPTLSDLHASISTLEYASKAKNIKNSAQIGAHISEEYLLNDLVEENRKLKLDLMATRKRENCIIMNDSNYKEMYLSQKTLKQEVEELRGYRVSLLTQLENHMKEIDAAKAEKQALTDNVQSLETKLVSFENQFKIQKEKEVSLKSKCNELYESFNKQLIAINESQSNMKSILTNKILNSLIDINSKIAQHSNSDNSMQFNTIKDNLNLIENELINISKLDFINSKDQLLNISFEIDNNKQELINLIDDYSETATKHSINNDKFTKFLMDEFLNDKDQILSLIQKELNLKITKFKNELSARIDDLVTDNLNNNYNSISKHYHDKLIRNENIWNTETQNISNSIQDSKIKFIKSITDFNNQLKPQLSECINNSELSIKQNNIINNSIYSINSEIPKLIKNIDSVNELCTSKDLEVEEKLKYFEKNINNLKFTIDEILNKPSVVESEEKLPVFEKENVIKMHENNNNQPLKVNLLNSNILLPPTTLKTNTTPKKGKTESLYTSRSTSPVRSPVRNAVRSPVRAAFGRKRSFNGDLNVKLKRRYTDL